MTCLPNFIDLWVPNQSLDGENFIFMNISSFYKPSTLILQLARNKTLLVSKTKVTGKLVVANVSSFVRLYSGTMRTLRCKIAMIGQLPCHRMYTSITVLMFCGVYCYTAL